MKSWDCCIDYLKDRDDQKESYSSKLFMDNQRKEVVCMLAFDIVLITCAVIYFVVV